MPWYISLPSLNRKKNVLSLPSLTVKYGLTRFTALAVKSQSGLPENTRIRKIIIIIIIFIYIKFRLFPYLNEKEKKFSHKKVF